jgi:hypothetical protein
VPFVPPSRGGDRGHPDLPSLRFTPRLPGASQCDYRTDFQTKMLKIEMFDHVNNDFNDLHEPPIFFWLPTDIGWWHASSDLSMVESSSSFMCG